MRCRYNGRMFDLVEQGTAYRMSLCNAINIACGFHFVPREHRPCNPWSSIPLDAGSVQIEGRFAWSRAYTLGDFWFVATMDLDKQFVNRVWFAKRMLT